MSILLLWGIILGIDYFRCINLKKTIFVISEEKAIQIIEDITKFQ